MWLNLNNNGTMANYYFIYSDTPSQGAINVNKVIKGELTPHEQQIVNSLRANGIIVQVNDKDGKLIKVDSFNAVCNWLYTRHINESTRTFSQTKEKIIYLIPVEPPINFGNNH